MLHATLRRLAARKLRLVTTGIAVVLGIAFLAGTLVLTDTIGRAFDTMSAGVHAGTDVLVRGKAAPGATAGMSGAAPTRPDVPAALVDTVRSVPGVADAQPTIEVVAQITHRAGVPVRVPMSMSDPVGMNWRDGDALNPFRVVEGSPPGADDQVVIDRAFAIRTGITVHDPVTVLTPAGARDVTVSGIATFGPYDSPGGATVVLFTTAAAQQALGAPGRAAGIAVDGDGIDQSELARRVADATGGDLEVVTGADLTAEARATAERNAGFLNTFLLAFALVAVFVGSFIIYNTFSMLVAQRTRETATLRALGASRGQILGSVLAEATAVGTVAAGLGVVAGIGLAAASLGLLRATGMDLPDIGVVLSPASLATAFATGVLVSVVSAALPARRATTVAPVAALRGAQVDGAARSGRRAVAGGLVATAGGALFAAGMVAGSAGLVGSGAAVVFVGVTVLGPVLAGPVSGVLGAPLARLRGVPGALARRNAMRNPTRTSTTAAALMVGVALVSFMTVLAASAKASVADAVERGFAGDYVVTATSMHAAGLPAELAERVAALPEAGAAVTVRRSPAVVDGTEARITGVDAAALRQLLTLETVAGDLDLLDATHVAVADREAGERSLHPGDTVEVAVPGSGPTRLTIAATYRGGDLVGPWLLDDAAYRPLVRSQLVDQVVVARAATASDDQARAALDGALAPYPQAAVQDRAGLIDGQAGAIDQLLNIVYALLALAVVIALIGIANTTALSIIERTRELGLLRSVGMSRGQLRSAVRWEAALIALLGAALGLAIGTVLGLAVASTLGGQGIEVVRAPGTELAAIAVLAGVAGALAAVLPARRASRLDVLAAVAAD